MRLYLLLPGAILLILALSTLAAMPPPGIIDQVPPGNEIGIGSSLPRLDLAGHILPGETTAIAPNLPSPLTAENAALHNFLLAARGALAAGRSGEAQQALEMAEVRELDRSVALFQTMVPSDDPLVAKIGAALRALGEGDDDDAMRLIEQALAMPPPGHLTRAAVTP